MTEEEWSVPLTDAQAIGVALWVPYVLISLAGGAPFPTPEGTILETLVTRASLLSISGVVIGAALMGGVAIVEAATLASKWKGNPTRGSWEKIRVMAYSGVALVFGGLPAFFGFAFIFTLGGVFLGVVTVLSWAVTELSELYGDGLCISESMQNQLGASSLLLFVMALIAQLYPIENDLTGLLLLLTAGALVLIIARLGESNGSTERERQAKLDSFE